MLDKCRKKGKALLLGTAVFSLSLSACTASYETYNLYPNEFLLGETIADDGSVITPASGSGIADSQSPNQLSAEDIQNMNGGNAFMCFSDEGYLTFLNGKYYDEKISDYEDAIASIQSMAQLLGMSAGSEFFCEYGETDPHGYTYYTFKQKYGEQTIQYATLRIIIDPDGYAAGLSCSFTPNIGIAEEVEWITPAQAEEIVQQIYSGRDLTVYSEYTKKIAVELSGTLYNCYAVYTSNFITDPVNAGLPYLENLVAYDGTFMGSLSTAVPTEATADERAYEYFEGKESSVYTGQVTLNDGTKKTISVPIAYDADAKTYYLMDVTRKIAVGDYASFIYKGYVNFSSSTTGKDWDNNHLIAYANYIDAYDYYSNMGIKSTDGTGVPILICCDWVDSNGNPVNNACNMGIRNGFSTFGASDANTYSEALDVVAHEFTHGVTGYSMGGMRYLNDTGAINEAYSDIMGNIIEMSLGATTDTDQWLIGEMSGEAMRNMSDPHSSASRSQPVSLDDAYYYDPVPDEYLDDSDYLSNHDNGGVHINNTLLSQMAYKLWKQGMSLDDEAWLWVTTMELITPLSGYEEVYGALLMSIDINGFDSSYKTFLTQEFQKAGLIA